MYNRGNNEDYANDNGKLKLNMIYNYNPHFKIISDLNGKAYNNENINLQYNQVEFKNRFNFSFSPEFAFIPIVGGIYDYKFKNSDPGILYGTGFNFYNLNKETNTSIKADYYSHFYDYKIRKNRNHQLNFNYFTKFSNTAKDSLYAGYSAKKNYEYYKDLNKEKIEIEELVFRNNAQINLTSSFIIDNVTQFKQRDFSQKRNGFTKSRIEKILSNRINLKYYGKKFLWKLGVLNAYQINDFTQKETETGKNDDYYSLISDNDNIQIAFTNYINYKFNDKQKINWIISHSKLEYNTPDSLHNFDDRDEIRVFNLIQYQYNLSKRLQWNVISGMKYFHQVFIYPQKSGLNKKEKTISIASNVRYKLNDFINTFGGAVSSYYLTYDFDAQSNLINRKLTISDTLKYTLLPHSKINLVAKYEIEEIGNLDWQKFVEQITRKNYYNYYICYLLHDITKLISIKPGISYIIRNDFSYSPKKRQIRKYRSESYWLEVAWKFSGKGYLKGKINKFIYKNSNINWNSFLRGNLEVLWYF